MHTILSQLNRLPGVVGSLVCAGDGRVLAQAFPTVFDQGAVQEAARALADAAQSLDPTTEMDDLLDLRFKEVRLLAKAFAGHLVAVLASRTTNLQLLILSLTASATKLERLQQQSGLEGSAEVEEAVAESPEDPAPQAAPAARVAVPTRGLDELRRRLGTLPEPAGPGPLIPGRPRAKT